MTATTRRPADPVTDLTTVLDRNVAAVSDLLDGQYGTVMRELARDAVSRAWMGGYLADASAVLLDITQHSWQAGYALTLGTGVSA